MRRRSPLPLPILQTCAAYFGTKEKRFNDNRCSMCPIHTPCLARGTRQPRDTAEFAASRATFISEAMAILP